MAASLFLVCYVKDVRVKAYLSAAHVTCLVTRVCKHSCFCCLILPYAELITYVYILNAWNLFGKTWSSGSETVSRGPPRVRESYSKGPSDVPPAEWINNESRTHTAWRTKCLNKKWLNMTEEVAYKKILNCTNKMLIIGLGRYLDKVQYKLLIEIKINRRLSVGSRK